MARRDHVGAHACLAPLVLELTEGMDLPDGVEAVGLVRQLETELGD